MIWIEAENTTNKQIPKWCRTSGMSKDNIVFVPAGVGGIDEKQVHLCSLYDSTPCVVYLNHYYVPAKWLGEEFPEIKEHCEMIEIWTRDYIAKNPQ